MQVGNKVSANLKINGFVEVDTILVDVATTSLQFTGLDGDTDDEYILDSIIVQPNAVSTSYYLHANGDKGSNYNRQAIQGQGSSLVSAYTASVSGISLSAASITCVHKATSCLKAKSGKVRTCLTSNPRAIRGTTVEAIGKIADEWTNTISNITSLLIEGTSSDNIGIGSKFTLYKRSRK